MKIVRNKIVFSNEEQMVIGNYECHELDMYEMDDHDIEYTDFPDMPELIHNYDGNLIYEYRFFDEMDDAERCNILYHFGMIDIDDLFGTGFLFACESKKHAIKWQKEYKKWQKENAKAYDELYEIQNEDEDEDDDE